MEDMTNAKFEKYVLPNSVALAPLVLIELAILALACFGDFTWVGNTALASFGVVAYIVLMSIDSSRYNAYREGYKQRLRQLPVVELIEALSSEDLDVRTKAFLLDFLNNERHCWNQPLVPAICAN